MLIIPALASAIGLYFYLTSGRYVSTDNAYVGAQKVLITPEVSGTVARISVTEGQLLKTGDELFAIEQQPFELALRNAEAQLASVRTSFAGLKSDVANLATQIEFARQTVSFHETELARKQTLVNAERFTTPELKEYEAKILDAQEKMVEIERRIFSELRTAIAGEARGRTRGADPNGQRGR